jgi:hypothetical protein
MLKLKGVFAKRLKDSTKKKMEDTLKRMAKVRKQDEVHLRTLIEEKLAWASSERLKGLSQIKHLEKNIAKLEGIIIVCKEILETKPKKEKKT